MSARNSEGTWVKVTRGGVESMIAEGIEGKSLTTYDEYIKHVDALSDAEVMQFVRVLLKRGVWIGSSP